MKQFQKFLYQKFTNQRNVISDLRISIERNNDAIDYLQNVLTRHENLLKFNENDEDAKYSIRQLKHTIFTLKFITTLYEDDLKKRIKKWIILLNT